VELKKNGNPPPTITVYFRKGDYVRSNTLELILEDSGKSNGPDDLSKVGTPETGFLIPSGSPAWSTGFKPIPFKGKGLYSDRYRRLNIR